MIVLQSKWDEALEGKMKEEKMKKLIKYWNEYLALGDYYGVHKYLKLKEEKSSCKLLWHPLRFCECSSDLWVKWATITFENVT